MTNPTGTDMEMALTWAKAITAALLMIAFCVASFALMGNAADYLQQIGWIN